MISNEIENNSDLTYSASIYYASASQQAGAYEGQIIYWEYPVTGGQSAIRIERTGCACGWIS